MTQRWHVAFTDSRCEQETAEEIHDELGYETFTPIQKLKRFKNGHKIIIEAPLYNRYIFARFDSDEDAGWNAIREIDGVCDILCSVEGTPSPVKCGVVEKLMRYQLHGLFDFTQAPNPFPPGSWARTDEDGPFSDLCGRIKRLRSGDRVELIINWLNKELVVNVPMARLSHI